MVRLLAIMHLDDPGRRAALVPLAVRLVAAGLAASVQVFLARFLGADGYGLFAYAWTVTMIGGYAATFGFSQIAVRFLARHAQDGDNATARGFMRFTLIGVGIAAGSLCAVAALILAMNGGRIGPNHAGLLLIVCAIIPVFAIGDLAEGFARSQGWTVLALAPGYVLRQIALMLLLPLALVLGQPADATTGLIAALFATAITAFGQMFVVLKCLSPVFATSEKPRFEPRLWIAAAAPVFLADAVQVLRQNADVLILAAFAPAGDVALYFAATRVAALLGLVEFAVGAAAAHRFARIDAGVNPGKLLAAARESAVLTFWPTLAAALTLWLVAPLVLALFGPDYRAATDVVLVLALAAAMRASIGPADDLLVMQGHGALNLAAQALGLAVTIGAGLALIPSHGPAGAALSVLLATGATVLALAFASGWRLGIVPTPLPASISLQRTTL